MIDCIKSLFQVNKEQSNENNSIAIVNESYLEIALKSLLNFDSDLNSHRKKQLVSLAVQTGLIVLSFTTAFLLFLFSSTSTTFLRFSSSITTTTFLLIPFSSTSDTFVWFFSSVTITLLLLIHLSKTSITFI